MHRTQGLTKTVIRLSLPLIYLLSFGSTAILPAHSQSTVSSASKPAGDRPYLNPAQPLNARVQELIDRMTLPEKISQLCNSAPAIPRLGVPAYDYWSEGLHGIAREGVATVFPQAIAMAATWDTQLVQNEGDVTATETRAKFNVVGQTADHRTYNGLTLWSPNINIFRDPRWGRGQETYGEDPYLTSRIGVAYIDGLQGSDPRYLKVAACAKHFAVHSGPEPLRHQFDAQPPERDLYETYLPQFEAAVRVGHVQQVMSAYNAIYGTPAPADRWLLTDLLRKQWGFQGYVVSDCDAVSDIVRGHHYAPDRATAAVDAVLAGTDLNCGGTYNALLTAAQDHQITEAQIDNALRRVLTVRFRLGLFDPPTYPYARIGIAENDTPQHSALALKAARESIVLLKNSGLLPLNRSKVKRIAVIGANADSVNMLLGNYNGTPSHPVTILQGIRDKAGSGIAVDYATGPPLAVKSADEFGPSSDDYKKSLSAAASADVVIYVGGISPGLEGEESQVSDIGFLGGDRTRIELPDVQESFLRALDATGKPVVYINCSGSAIAMPWEAEHLPAILQAWYPGENGGTAVADILFGDCNPSGHLPVTFYASTGDLPSFTSYSMANRTYRYFKGKALYPFGYGLSYTTFKIGKPSVSAGHIRTGGGTLTVSVPVRNTGKMGGDEVVQAYVRNLASNVPQPIRSLCGFQRISIPRGQLRTALLTISSQQLRYWDVKKQAYVVDPGAYQIQIGTSSSDIAATSNITVSR